MYVYSQNLIYPIFRFYLRHLHLTLCLHFSRTPFVLCTDTDKVDKEIACINEGSSDLKRLFVMCLLAGGPLPIGSIKYSICSLE